MPSLQGWPPLIEVDHSSVRGAPARTSKPAFIYSFIHLPTHSAFYPLKYLLGLVPVLGTHQRRQSLPFGRWYSFERDGMGRWTDTSGSDKCCEWDTVGWGERGKRIRSAILARMVGEGLCWRVTLRGTEGWVGENIWEASLLGRGSSRQERQKQAAAGRQRDGSGGEAWDRTPNAVIIRSMNTRCGTGSGRFCPRAGSGAGTVQEQLRYLP